MAPDARSILYGYEAGPAQWDIWRLPLEGGGAPEPWLATPTLEASPSFSADGRFVAYRSDESGAAEAYVRPHDGVGLRHQISVRGGTHPRWSPDGREIFFMNRGSMWAVSVRTAPTFAAEAPRELFKVPDEIVLGFFGFYDITPDRQRFIMIQKDPFEVRPIGLALVPNWLEELKAKMAAAR